MIKTNIIKTVLGNRLWWRSIKCRMVKLNFRGLNHLNKLISVIHDGPDCLGTDLVYFSVKIRMLMTDAELK